MKFLYGLRQAQGATADAAREAAVADTMEAMGDEDEITDEVLLEAIVGTGAPNCSEVRGNSRSPAANSIAHRHKHH